VRGHAAKADDTGLQPRFELAGRQVKKNAEPAYRGASDVVRAAPGQRDGIEPERVGARQRCVSRQLAGSDAGYVSISHIVSIAPEDGSEPRPVQLVQRGPLPSAGERALDQECSATYLFVPVYHLFTEGFDTLDLKDAKALLEELAQREGGRKFVSLLRARTVAFAACFRNGRSCATLPYRRRELRLGLRAFPRRPL
jgi:hypothetical protein